MLTACELQPADLRELISRSFALLGRAETALLVDGIKRVGFEAATRGGMTIGVSDIPVPGRKAATLAEADEKVAALDGQYQTGLITEDERYDGVVKVWQQATKDVSDQMMEGLDEMGPLTMMTRSGARGNKGNIGQLGAGGDVHVVADNAIVLDDCRGIDNDVFSQRCAGTDHRPGQHHGPAPYFRRRRNDC